MSEPLFDPSLKKKKAKKQLDLSELDALDAPAAPVESEKAAAAVAEPPSASAVADTVEKVADEPEDLGFGDLKKKKKKKALPLDFELDGTPQETPAVTGDGVPLEQVSADAADKDAAAAAGDDLDFGMMKKKKKSKKGAFDLEAFEKEIVGDEGGAEKAGGAGGEEDEDLGDDPFRQEGEDEEEKEAEETWHGTDRDYTYQELLGRVFSTLRAQNPALAGEKKKYTMVPPSVLRDGSKKTVFANIVEICKRMHRQPDHVIQYLFSELGTEGSVDGAQRLVIKGRFQPKQIEHVLRRYIIEYVTCKTCKSPRTLLKKENRIFFMVCEACGSQRSVTTIKTGFQAQTGRRSKMRAQT